MSSSFPVQLVAAAAVLAAAPAPGQVAPGSHQSDASVIHWSAGVGTAGPFRSVVVGDLTGDRRKDAAVLDGNRVVLLFGVDSYSALSDLTLPGLDVIDVALFPGEVQDSLYTTSTLGLVRHTFDPQEGAFEHVLEDDFRWRSARHVRIRDLDGQYGPDLVGIAGDGRSLLTRFADGSGGWISGYTIVFAEHVEGLELLDWDADGVLEVAGLSSVGLEVFEQDGGAPVVFEATRPGGHLTSMRRIGGGECLCWVGRDPTDSYDLLRTIAADVEFAPQPLLFAPDEGLSPVPVSVAGVRVQDVDGDGFDDLLLAHSSFHRAIVLVNAWTEGASPLHPFSVASGGFTYHDLSADPTQSLPHGETRPAFDDVDLDGQADIVYPLDDAPRRVRVLTRLGSQPPPEAAPGDDVMQRVEFDAPVGGTAQLELFLRIPQDILDGPWTHAQVVLWRQSGQGALESTSLGNVLHELQTAAPPGQDPARQKLVVDVPGEGPAPWTTQRHYYVDLRFVIALTGDPPHVQAATASWMHGWRITDDPEDSGYGPWADYLRSLPSAGDPVPIFEPHLGFEPGGIIIGIDVPLGRVPNHGEQEVPEPQPPSSTILSAVFY